MVGTNSLQGGHHESDRPKNVLQECGRSWLSSAPGSVRAARGPAGYQPTAGLSWRISRISRTLRVSYLWRFAIPAPHHCTFFNGAPFSTVHNAFLQQCHTAILDPITGTKRISPVPPTDGGSHARTQGRCAVRADHHQLLCPQGFGRRGGSGPPMQTRRCSTHHQQCVRCAGAAWMAATGCGWAVVHKIGLFCILDHPFVDTNPWKLHGWEIHIVCTQNATYPITGYFFENEHMQKDP